MIRGPYTPSLRLQRTPFGRCWYILYIALNFYTRWFKVTFLLNNPKKVTSRIARYRYIYIPKQSMYNIFTYIYHEHKLNVGKYTIHGWYGIYTCQPATLTINGTNGFPLAPWPFANPGEARGQLDEAEALDREVAFREGWDGSVEESWPQWNHISGWVKYDMDTGWYWISIIILYMVVSFKYKHEPLKFGKHNYQARCYCRCFLFNLGDRRFSVFVSSVGHQLFFINWMNFHLSVFPSSHYASSPFWNSPKSFLQILHFPWKLFTPCR